MRNLFCLLPIALMGCVSLSASDTVSINETVPPIDFVGATIPVGTTLPPETMPTQQVPVDVSDIVSKLNSLGSTSFTVTESQISGDMSFISNIEVDLITETMGTLVFIKSPVNSSAMVNQFPVLISSQQLLNALSDQATLEFTLMTNPLSGSVPAQTLSLNYTLVLNTTESVSKSL